jgi:glutamate dehydrogenase/leucine dehydrogenase
MIFMIILVDDHEDIVKLLGIFRKDNHQLRTKAGLPFKVTYEDLKGLYSLISVKNSLQDIPLGGVKSCTFTNLRGKKYGQGDRCQRTQLLTPKCRRGQ